MTVSDDDDDDKLWLVAGQQNCKPKKLISFKKKTMIMRKQFVIYFSMNHHQMNRSGLNLKIWSMTMI